MANKIARCRHDPQKNVNMIYKIINTTLMVAQTTKWLNGGPKRAWDSTRNQVFEAKYSKVPCFGHK